MISVHQQDWKNFEIKSGQNLSIYYSKYYLAIMNVIHFSQLLKCSKKSMYCLTFSPSNVDEIYTDVSENKINQIKIKQSNYTFTFHTTSKTTTKKKQVIKT